MDEMLLMGTKYGESKKKKKTHTPGNYSRESERHECSVINIHLRLNFIFIPLYLFNHPFE